MINYNSNTYRDAVEELLKEIEKLKRINLQLTREKNGSVNEELKAENERLRKDNVRLIREKNHLYHESIVEGLEEENEKLKNEVEVQRAKISKLTNAMNEREFIVESLTRTNGILKNKFREYKEFKREKSSIIERNKELLEENKQLKNELDNVIKLSDKQGENLKKLRNEIKETKTELEETKSTLATVIAHNKEIFAEKENLKELSEENEKLKEEISDKENNIISLNKENSELKSAKEKSTTNAGNAKAKKEISSLKKDIEKCNKELQSTVDENVALQKMIEDLTEQLYNIKGKEMTDEEKQYKESMDLFNSELENMK